MYKYSHSASMNPDTTNGLPKIYSVLSWGCDVLPGETFRLAPQSQCGDQWEKWIQCPVQPITKQIGVTNQTKKANPWSEVLEDCSWRTLSVWKKLFCLFPGLWMKNFWLCKKKLSLSKFELDSNLKTFQFISEKLKECKLLINQWTVEHNTWFMCPTDVLTIFFSAAHWNINIQKGWVFWKHYFAA